VIAPNNATDKDKAAIYKLIVSYSVRQRLERRTLRAWSGCGASSVDGRVSGPPVAGGKLAVDAVDPLAEPGDEIINRPVKNGRLGGKYKIIDRQWVP
jgi:hypothetical protein